LNVLLSVDSSPLLTGDGSPFSFPSFFLGDCVPSLYGCRTVTFRTSFQCVCNNSPPFSLVKPSWGGRMVFSFFGAVSPFSQQDAWITFYGFRDPSPLTCFSPHDKGVLRLSYAVIVLSVPPYFSESRPLPLLTNLSSRRASDSPDSTFFVRRG